MGLVSRPGRDRLQSDGPLVPVELFNPDDRSKEPRTVMALVDTGCTDPLILKSLASELALTDGGKREALAPDRVSRLQDTVFVGFRFHVDSGLPGAARDRVFVCDTLPGLPSDCKFVLGRTYLKDCRFTYAGNSGSIALERNEPEKPPPELLPVLVTEMNNRSRWYISQLWQVPFAYFALVGVLISTVDDKWSSYLSIALPACAVFGGLVFWHMCYLQKGAERAIENLGCVERGDALMHRAQYKRSFFLPFFIAVGLAVLLLLIAMSVLLCRVGTSSGPSPQSIGTSPGSVPVPPPATPPQR